MWSARFAARRKPARLSSGYPGASAGTNRIMRMSHAPTADVEDWNAGWSGSTALAVLILATDLGLWALILLAAQWLLGLLA
jgi:hypothetical protein